MVRKEREIELLPQNTKLLDRHAAILACRVAVNGMKSRVRHHSRCARELEVVQCSCSKTARHSVSNSSDDLNTLAARLRHARWIVKSQTMVENTFLRFGWTHKLQHPIGYSASDHSLPVSRTLFVNNIKIFAAAAREVWTADGEMCDVIQGAVYSQSHYLHGHICDVCLGLPAPPSPLLSEMDSPQ